MKIREFVKVQCERCKQRRAKVVKKVRAVRDRLRSFRKVK